MSFQIASENGKYVVYGVDDNGNTFLIQQFNPFTGEDFASVDECMNFLKLVMGASDEQIEVEETGVDG
jgi:hypothetical protein